jgi:hypothetical protein
MHGNTGRSRHELYDSNLFNTSAIDGARASTALSLLACVTKQTNKLLPLTCMLSEQGKPICKLVCLGKTLRACQVKGVNKCNELMSGFTAVTYLLRLVELQKTKWRNCHADDGNMSREEQTDSGRSSNRRRWREKNKALATEGRTGDEGATMTSKYHTAPL